jgi:hypothetical protein
MIHFGDKFTFVHIPKTGGQWATDILKRHLTVDEEYSPHIMPFEDQILPIVAVVRDPKTWWESWITWGRFSPDKDPYYTGIVSELDMRPADQIVASYKSNMAWLARTSPIQCVADMARQGIGPLTHRIRTLKKHNVYWVRYESLRDDWCYVLTRLGLLTDELRVDLQTIPACNVTEKRSAITIDISDLEPGDGII